MRFIVHVYIVFSNIQNYQILMNADLGASEGVHQGDLWHPLGFPARGVLAPLQPAESAFSPTSLMQPVAEPEGRKMRPHQSLLECEMYRLKMNWLDSGHADDTLQRQ